MLKAIFKLIYWIDNLNELVGRVVSWLTTILVLLFCYDVATRYLFNFSKVWVIELEWHLFALIFLFGAGYTLLKDRHVRVDVFYGQWSEKRQAWINFLGTLFFLIPWCVLIIWTGLGYAEMSYTIGEGSANPGGLPHRFIIKYAVVIGALLLLLQGISLLTKSLLIIIGAVKYEKPSAWKH